VKFARLKNPQADPSPTTIRFRIRIPTPCQARPRCAIRLAPMPEGSIYATMTTMTTVTSKRRSPLSGMPRYVPGTQIGSRRIHVIEQSEYLHETGDVKYSPNLRIYANDGDRSIAFARRLQGSYERTQARRVYIGHFAKIGDDQSSPVLRKFDERRFHLGRCEDVDLALEIHHANLAIVRLPYGDTIFHAGSFPQGGTLTSEYPTGSMPNTKLNPRTRARGAS
jgi:hypothetical protein